MADNTKPFHGIATQYGKLELVDISGELLKLSKLNLLRAKLPVKILLNAPERNANESYPEYFTRVRDCVVGDLLTENFRYSMLSLAVVVDLSDSVLDWEKVFFPAVADYESNTAKSFFDALVSVTAAEVNVSESIKEEMEATTMPDGFLSAGGLSTAWSVFCAAMHRRIFKNRKGELWLT